MKYYSEILKVTFNTEKECLDAEAAHIKEQEQKLQATKRKAYTPTKRKKELAKQIEEAEQKLKEANNAYELASKNAAEILEKSNAEVKAILDIAKRSVKEAEKRRLEAILKFNEEFGTYSKTISGDEAIAEFNRLQNRFESTIAKFLREFNWF